MKKESPARMQILKLRQIMLKLKYPPLGHQTSMYEGHLSLKIKICPNSHSPEVTRAPLDINILPKAFLILQAKVLLAPPMHPLNPIGMY